MADYEARIIDSSREFTAKERIQIKSSNDAESLKDLIEQSENGNVTIKPVDYAVVEVHNENGETKDYTRYILIDAEGNKYYTNSEPFWSTFIGIWDEIKDEEADGEDWALKVFMQESKKRTQPFMTCTIV